MNKQIDLSNTGGFPLEEDTLNFMQQSYTGAFSAIAKMCGDKVILFGVEVIGSNVTPGWIAYNGELIQFVGGSLAAKVSIATVATAATFEDLAVRNVYQTKTATCGALGDFNFSELTPLLALQNTWLPGDLKQKYVDNAYIAANFDVNGYGLLKERGWRILSSAVPAAAGKVMVNRDAADALFDTAGNTGGEKAHFLTKQELPSVQLKSGIYNNSVDYVDGGASPNNIGPLVNAQPVLTEAMGDGLGHNNLQPYFVVLTLIKL